LRIEQAQGRRGDHSLFYWPVCVPLSGLKVAHGMDAIAERPFGESWELSRVTIGKRNGDAIRR
jgi:hypothetical protein